MQLKHCSLFRKKELKKEIFNVNQLCNCEWEQQPIFLSCGAQEMSYCCQGESAANDTSKSIRLWQDKAPISKITANAQNGKRLVSATRLQIDIRLHELSEGRSLYLDPHVQSTPVAPLS